MSDVVNHNVRDNLKLIAALVLMTHGDGFINLWTGYRIAETFPDLTFDEYLTAFRICRHNELFDGESITVIDEPCAWARKQLIP